MSASFSFAPPQAAIAVGGDSKSFRCAAYWRRRIISSIREMGKTSGRRVLLRQACDMVEPDGATIPYRADKDLHHEVELIVAMKSGGLNIPATRHWTTSGATASVRPHPPRPAAGSRKKERPWEIGKILRHSAPAARAAGVDDRSSRQGGSGFRQRHERQTGDLAELSGACRRYLAAVAAGFTRPATSP